MIARVTGPLYFVCEDVLMAIGDQTFTFGSTPYIQHAGDVVYRFDRTYVPPSRLDWRVDQAELKARLAGQGEGGTDASGDDWPNGLGGFA